MKRNAKKYVEDGITFDSQVEINLYHRFIRGNGYHFKHHEHWAIDKNIFERTYKRVD